MPCGRCALPTSFGRRSGDMDRVLRLSDDPLLRFQKLSLSPADGFLLSRVDGTTSARQVVEMIPLPAEDTERSLLCLLATGAVEFATEPRAPPVARCPARPCGPAGRLPASAPPPPTPRPQTPPAAAVRARHGRRLSRRPTAAGPTADERRREILEMQQALEDAEPLRGARHLSRVRRGRGEGGLLSPRQALPPRRPPRQLAERSARHARERLHPARRGLRGAARSPTARRLRGAAGTTACSCRRRRRWPQCRRAEPSPPRETPPPRHSTRRPGSGQPSEAVRDARSGSSTRRSTGTPSSCSSRSCTRCRRACVPAGGRCSPAAT